MTIFSKSRHRTQNLCKMRYKEEYFLQMEKEFLLSKMSYLSLGDGFMRCKDTKNTMKSIMCQIKCVQAISIFMYLLGKCKLFVEKQSLF